ncbi:MAG TPA: LysR family transcriptional regulator, partial [Povalibacter sp.]
MTILARRLNYQHLLYFWAVVRAGSLTKACEELHLSAPTVSTQLRTFEQRIGQTLLAKSGRKLVPTKAGRIVFRYAEEIFTIGGDLLNALAHRSTDRPLRLVVGIDDVLPKEIAQRLLEATLDLQQPAQLICREGTLDHLLAALRLHEIDVVLSDSPVTPSINDQAYNH